MCLYMRGGQCHKYLCALFLRSPRPDVKWAVELLKYGIRVNAIVVAECWTPAYEKWITTLENGDEKLKEITSKIPLGNRMTTAEEIANTTAFLLSKCSSHTTGQLIYVDGGYVHLDRALANA